MSDWTRFTKRISINASIKDIYNAWASQSEIESWFLRKARYKDAGGVSRGEDDPVQKGDNYEWMWYGYPDEVVERNKIFETNGKDLIKFGFADKCIVTIRIYEEEGEHVIELTQENIPVDENPSTNLFVGCGEGWTFYLVNLKSVLEGGLDLRNKNEKLKKVINS